MPVEPVDRLFGKFTREFLIFCGFILANFLVLLVYGIWFDHRPYRLRVRLSDIAGEIPDIPFLYWYGPYLVHVVVRIAVFVWRRQYPRH